MPSVPANERDYYLVQHPPARSQYRAPRRTDRGPYSGLQVIHTAENSPDLVLPDSGAENVANFISERSTPGSYHTLSDSDSILWMIPLWWEAFHDGTGSNRWSVGHSMATRADQWGKIPQTWIDATIANMAVAAVATSVWAKENGLPITPAVRISKAQSEQRVPGFISHGDRDPGRRHDPGEMFDWDWFLHLYAYFANENGIFIPIPPSPRPEGNVMTQEEAEEIVASLYPIFAGRKGDAGGIEWWASRMASGEVSETFVSYNLAKMEGMPKIWGALADLNTRMKSLEKKQAETADRLEALESAPPPPPPGEKCDCEVCAMDPEDLVSSVVDEIGKRLTE